MKPRLVLVAKKLESFDCCGPPSGVAAGDTEAIAAAGDSADA
jgi:hypothetical protein